jgi:hypothetical protein
VDGLDVQGEPGYTDSEIPLGVFEPGIEEAVGAGEMGEIVVQGLVENAALGCLRNPGACLLSGRGSPVIWPSGPVRRATVAAGMWMRA